MARLEVDALTVSAAKDCVLLDAVSLSVATGEMVAVVGPNGAGKSTLIRALAGVELTRQHIRIDGHPLEGLGHAERARQIAWLPQALPAAWPVLVRDAVALGRYAFGAVPGQMSAADEAAVAQALRCCDVTGLADRRITTLSGGELARVHMARMIATDAAIMLADEPVAALDPSHRMQMMALFAAQARAGRTVIVVLHDIGLASRWCDRIIALDSGRIVADGSPTDIVTPQFMRSLFDVETELHWIDGRPVPIVIRAAGQAAD